MPNGGGTGLTRLEAMGATPATEADEALNLPACEHRVRCQSCNGGGEALYCTMGCECDRQLIYPRPDGQPPLCWDCELQGTECDEGRLPSADPPA
jgi:hypothetical protein